MMLKSAETGFKVRDSSPMLIPMQRFDLSSVSPRHRKEAWQHACDGFFDLAVDNDHAAAPTAFFTWHRLDDLMFSSGYSYPTRATRRPAHIRRQRNYVRLLFPRRNSSRLISDNHLIDLSPGLVHLIDYSRPFVHIRDPGVNLDGVYLPHDVVGYDPSRHPAYTGLSTRSPAGRVLSIAFHTLRSQLSRVTISEAPSLADGFIYLIRTLMLHDTTVACGSGVERRPRRDAMRAYIEQNLQTSSLDADDLARSFAVSRPTLFRDFEDWGGVTRYIWNRRLERAYIDLVDRPPTRGAVRAVGERWGFGSSSHFSRRFKAQFGVSPSEVVGIGVEPRRFAPGRSNSSGHIHHDDAPDSSMIRWFSPPRKPASI